MALMASCGEITPMPVAAIFADTQAEPKSVYTWLDWLEKQLPFAVFRVTAGNLEQDTLKIRQRKDGKGAWCPSGIPYYSINSDGSGGHGPRQCTHDFKLKPLLRAQRAILKRAQRKKAVTWIGISVDEAHRMKPSRVRYAENRWPLVEKSMTRYECLLWMKAHSFPTPPRSACVFCPYHSDAEWRRLRDQEPDEFKRAVAFDKAFREARIQTCRKKGFVPFLHSSRVPLDQVDFSTQEERGQLNMFINECEGMCGV